MKSKTHSTHTPHRPGAAARVGAASHEVRIIGGQWKRTRIKVDDKPGLRPTPDRVRETLFNWLGQDLSGWRCLDAFAGTGALGFEAASRGAAEVVLVEQDSALVARLAHMRTQLLALRPKEEGVLPSLVVQRGEGVTVLGHRSAASCDLVFLDPPFDAPLLEPALAACPRILSPHGLVYLEAPSEWTDERLAPLGLKVRKHLKAGAVHAHLLTADPT